MPDPFGFDDLARDLARVTAERDRLAREVGDLNDSVGVVDTCQIKPLIDGLTAERDALRAEVEAMRAVVEAARVVFDRDEGEETWLDWKNLHDALDALDALRTRKVGE